MRARGVCRPTGSAAHGRILRGLPPCPGCEYGVSVTLDVFSPAVRRGSTPRSTRPPTRSAKGWPAIARGEHTLLLAPTGSGKTLAAFLWAIDRLAAEPPPAGARAHPRPLRLAAPGARGRRREEPARPARRHRARRRAARPRLPHQPVVGVRTGDTPRHERRQMLRRPPDILITTPESLYLLLTSQARETLRGVRWVIVDEIHALAATKRGAHLRSRSSGSSSSPTRRRSGSACRRRSARSRRSRASSAARRPTGRGP